MNILIAGGGIAGAETALTISQCIPDANITMISAWPALRILPNLGYIPFGVAPGNVEIDLPALLKSKNINFVQGLVNRVFSDKKEVQISNNTTLGYDSLILAPGATPRRLEGYHLRTLEDALSLQIKVEELMSAPRGRVMIRALPGNSWTPPAYEFALLLGHWIQHSKSNLEISLITSESQPFAFFGTEASDLVKYHLDELGIETLTNVPPGRIEGLSGDFNLDFVPLEARRVRQLSGMNESGFYNVDDNSLLGKDIYVVGDAADLIYKAAFATSWQARKIVKALGGDLNRLGVVIDEVPVNMCEYQLDTGMETIHIRFNTDSHFREPYIDSRIELYEDQKTAHKLAGTMLRQTLQEQGYELPGSRAFRELL